MQTKTSLRAVLRATIGALTAAAMLIPATAAATSDHDAVAHKHTLVQQRAERGLLIGKGNAVGGAEGVFALGGTVPWGIGVPLRLGATHKLDLFARAHLQDAEPNFALPRLGGMYKFRDDLLEIAAEVSADVSMFGGGNKLAIDAGVPMRMHFRENLSLQATPSVHIAMKPKSDVYPNVRLSAFFNFTDEIAITGHTGFTFKSGQAGPTGLQIGTSYTFANARHSPWLELGGHVEWNKMYDDGATRVLAFARVYRVHPEHHKTVPPIIGEIED